jgi:HK97 family phage major capsid protein
MNKFREMFKIDLSNESLRAMSLETLKNEKNLVLDTLKGFLDQIDSEKRDLSKTEDLAYREGEKYLSDISDEIGKRPANQPPAMHFTSGESSARGHSAEFGKVGASFDELFEQTGMIKYRNDMAIQEFCQAITSQSYEGRTMSGLSGESGGFAIPILWEKDIYNSVQDESFALRKCRIFPMTSKYLHVPAWNSEDQTSGHWAGVEIQRIQETGTATPRTPKMRDVEMTYIQDAMYVDISRQAIMDAPNLGSSLGQGMIYALQQNFDDEVLTGSGVGGPLGVVDAPASVHVTRNTASTVTYNDIVNLRARLHPVFARNAVWVASTDVLSTLLLLEDTGGSYIFPSTFRGVDSAVPDTMLGREIFWTDKLSEIGTAGDLCLVDFGAVALGLRQGIFLENSTAPGWYQNLVSYRAITFWDAKPLLQSPITPRNGSANTLSFAAVLE